MRLLGARIAALSALLLSLTSTVAAAETVDQLLREATAYLERRSCDSARSILDEIPGTDRDARAHLLMARTGGCLEDVRMTAEALDLFDDAGGSDPAADELRGWVQATLDSLRAGFSQALDSGDCAVAKGAVQRLLAAAGAVSPLDLGLLARCDKDLGGVDEVLRQLDEAQLADPRAEVLRDFAAESRQALRASFERDLAEDDCQSAGSMLRHLEEADDQILPIDRGRVARCRDDIAAVLRILGDLRDPDLARPEVVALREFVEEYRQTKRAGFDSAISAGECVAAGTNLSQLGTAAADVSSLDRGMLARCRGDRAGVEAVLVDLSVRLRDDSRAAILQQFLDEGVSSQRVAFEALLDRDDCAAATAAFQVLKSLPGYSDDGELQSLTDQARLGRCAGDAALVAELLDRPAMRTSEHAEIAALREWLEVGPVSVSFRLLADGVEIERGMSTRGGVAEGTTMLPLPVPPHLAPVSFALSIPADYDAVGAGVYSVHLDPTLHPAVDAYQALLVARRRARPVRAGTAILAGVSAAFLVWGGVEVGLAHSAAQEANGITDPSGKARFLELQAGVTGAYPRIGIAFGLSAASLSFTIVLPARRADILGSVRRARSSWRHLGSEPVDWSELTP